jgi:hypothetical protein
MQQYSERKSPDLSDSKHALQTAVGRVKTFLMLANVYEYVTVPLYYYYYLKKRTTYD